MKVEGCKFKGTACVLSANVRDDGSRNSTSPSKKAKPPWMKGFGKLADLKAENAKLMTLIEEEFEHNDQENRES